MNRLFYIIFILSTSPLWAQDNLVPESFSTDPLEAYRQHYTRARDLMETDPYTSLKHGRLAIENAENTGNEEKQAKAHFLMAKVAYKLQEYVLAYKHFVWARELFREVGDGVYEHWCTHNIAGIYVIAGDFDEAEQDLNRSQAFLYPLVEASDQALLVRDYGNFLLEQTRYVAAIPQLRKAIRIAPHSDRNLAYANIRLAYCYKQLGESDSAEHYYERAYEHSKAANLPLVFTKSTSDLGFYALERGEYQKAKEYLLQGYTINQTAWVPFATRVPLMNNLALASFGLEQPHKGHDYLQEIIQDSSFSSGDESILYTYDILIHDYLLQFGNPESIVEARKARAYHRDRIATENKNIAPIVHSGIIVFEADRTIGSFNDLLVKFGKWSLFIIPMVGFLLFWVSLRQRKKRLATIGELKDQLAKERELSKRREAQVNEFGRRLNDFANGRKPSQTN